MTAFFLSGAQNAWPNGIAVFCKEHYTVPQSPPKKGATSFQKKQELARWYQERRIDIF